MLLPTVRLPAVTVTARVAPSVTAPVPRFKSFVPTNAKSPFQLWALFVERVIAPPLVLFKEPPVMTRVPFEMALALLIASVPEVTVVLPP